MGWDGGVLPGLARQRRGHGTGRTGRLLAGVPVAGSWGGQGASWRILGSWAAFCLRGAVLGRRSPNRQQTVRVPVSGLARGRRPLAWRRSVPAGGGRAPGALPAWAGKVPRTGAPACRPAPRGIRLTAPRGRPQRGCSLPSRRAAVRRRLGPPRLERASLPESRASTPAGGAPPNA